MKAQPKIFALRSRRIVTRDGLRDAAIIVNGERIVVVDAPQNLPADLPIEDVGDLVVAPGLVDPHVHINEPGRTAWEGFEAATRAAAAGGVTTLVDMPLNSSPVTTTIDALQAKLASARNTMHVDCGFHAGLVPSNADRLKPLLSSGVLGIKAFMIHSGIDEFPATTESDFRTAMPIIAESGLPLLVHAELSKGNQPAGMVNARSYQEYLRSRPRQWENDGIALMIRLCKEYRCRVHIVHVSSSEAIAMLRDAKEAGLPVTAETCPHYLFFNAEDVADGDTTLKCAPPIRERENNEKLWDALKAGVLDVVASDHSPCPPDMKMLSEGDFARSWGGIASLQLGLSIMWTSGRRRGISLEDLSRMMSTRPARLVGLDTRKGEIAEGFDADLVIWNPEESFEVRSSMIHHRHKLTPYEGQSLFGKVESTFLRGKKIFDKGRLASPSGNVVLKESQNPKL
jgi:allantoinase